MIKDVKIKNKMQMKIPKKGWYAKLEWMYGDADGYKTTTAGPFPENCKSLFIEFLNTLQRMVDRFKYGMGGLDDYNDVPGVKKFFTCNFEDTDNEEFEGLSKEEIDFLLRFSLNIEQIPDGSLSCACLTGFSAFWHDGECINRYEVKFYI